MHEYLRVPDRLRKHLIQKLDRLLVDTVRLDTPLYERTRIRGNCDEIEALLKMLFDITDEQLNLLEEKVIETERYLSQKSRGYMLDDDGNGNKVWFKDGKQVEPHFWLADNGIGDEQARKAEEEFKAWLIDHDIANNEWMLEAGVVPSRIIELARPTAWVDEVDIHSDDEKVPEPQVITLGFGRPMDVET